MITSSTLSATHRITVPIIGPNVASPPKAKTGILSLPFASNALLSVASLPNARNWAKPAGLRIERRVVLALRFIKPLRVLGKIVPEAVEINTLAAGNQTLHVLTTEAKVPHGRIHYDMLPGSDAGQRRIDRHPSGHALEVGGGNCVADHDADVVRHQLDL